MASSRTTAAASAGARREARTRRPARTPPVRRMGRAMATTEEPRAEARARTLSTISGIEVEPLYTPARVPIDYERDLGSPGEYPFTRGVYPTMYRGRLWTMRQFAGFGTAAETNARFRYLLEHGQTGLSTAFDMPTLMGYDSDHARSLGEVGREGVAIDSLADMETLFDGIPLGEVSTSMTINGPAAMLLAFYACVGEEQGVALEQLRGTVQTDILKEYIAQKEWIFPPAPSMRLVVDMVEWCSERPAAVIGGTRSLHTNSFDEALALPTEHAVRLALRTQQVIAHETGVVNTIDPLAGSYYLEQLTNELERQAYDYFERIDELGGVIPAIEQNFQQREIAEASFRYQSEVERGERIVVVVNRYELEEEQPIEILRIDPALEQKQIERVQAVRASRDSAAAEAALARLKADAEHADRNLMEPIMA